MIIINPCKIKFILVAHCSPYTNKAFFPLIKCY